MTLILRTDGVTVDINPAEVEALEPLPPAYLPVGIPAGTWVRFAAAPPIAVQGTVAAVAATLAIPTSTLGGSSFIFRPGAADVPAAGVFGTWASLTAGIATLVANGVPFTVVVDLSTLGASFPVPAPTNFGGQCTLKGIPNGFNLQATSVNTLSGIVELDDIIIEAPALGGATGVIIMPLGASQLTMRGIAQLVSNNAAGPVIVVSINDTLTIEMHDTSSLATGANAAVEMDGPAATLQVIAVDNAVMQAGCIADGAAPGGALILVKGSLSVRLPATLAGVVGYNAGGVTTTATLNASGPVVHGGQFGAPGLVAAGVPVIAGTYFLLAGGNDGSAFGGVVDSPLIEPQNSNRPRVLDGAFVFADVDGTDGVNPSQVECRINGVLVPGMAANPATLMQLNTTPIQLTPTQGGVVLAPNDVVSVAFVLGAAGIVLSPVNPRALLLVG